MSISCVFKAAPISTVSWYNNRYVIFYLYIINVTYLLEGSTEGGEVSVATLAMDTKISYEDNILFAVASFEL